MSEKKYRVEAGVTKTSTIPVEAESEEEAREKAKEAAKQFPGDLELAEAFTNNVREVGEQ